jgi:ABC-2 type transport system ATP-binding protein
MLVEISNLVKEFGGFKAVDDLSFSIRRGEILGLLGPNGAGKTTTIQMLLGLVTPTSGEIRVFGRSLETDRSEILKRVNFTSPYVTFPFRLTVFENLMVFARLYDLPDPRGRIAELLATFSIERLRDKPIARLSSGENTTVGLCKALMNSPDLILLDEPTAYLDPEVAGRVKQVILDDHRRRGTTILLTSHNMAEVEKLCERIVFLHHGRLVASGSAVEVTQAILQEERDQPSLEEVFLQVARST